MTDTDAYVFLDFPASSEGSVHGPRPTESGRLVSRMDLKLVLLESAIRNTRMRGRYSALVDAVRFAIVIFFVLLAIRCFGPWGGTVLDVTVALLFVAAGVVHNVVDPSVRAERHARLQRQAYEAIARLETIVEGDREGLAEVVELQRAIRADETAAGEAVGRRSLRAARLSLGMDPNGHVPSILFH